ncbi:hypothetical protein ACEWY4_016464 [Coilia grayii]|uniref:Uncharacterized protein n=1 Tax=Coilia grayii TaxID=363190 RepID=A0ABD1JN47_9TELE
MTGLRDIRLVVFVEAIRKTTDDTKRGLFLISPLVNMHALFACAFLVLSLSSGEALKCNFCVSKSDSCVPSTQTCPPYLNACASVLFISPPLGITRSCMSMSTCQTYQQMPNVAAICCSSDLCN